MGQQLLPLSVSQGCLWVGCLWGTGLAQCPLSPHNSEPLAATHCALHTRYTARAGAQLRQVHSYRKRQGGSSHRTPPSPPPPPAAPAAQGG